MASTGTPVPAPKSTLQRRISPCRRGRSTWTSHSRTSRDRHLDFLARRRSTTTAHTRSARHAETRLDQARRTTECRAQGRAFDRGRRFAKQWPWVDDRLVSDRKREARKLRPRFQSPSARESAVQSTLANAIQRSSPAYTVGGIGAEGSAFREFDEGRGEDPKR